MGVLGVLGSRFSMGSCQPLQVWRESIMGSSRCRGQISIPRPPKGRFCLASSSSPNEASTSDDFQPPQETVLQAISEVSKAEGRISQTTNLVMGGTVSGASDEEWRILDEKVNSYPTTRGFTAIGTGGEDFVQSMVGAVESVLHYSIPKGDIKLTSRGKYVSVKIGPVEVDSSDQVQAVYKAMRSDVRMKYFL